MIKRIIFDVDDTLIDFVDEYWNSISKAFTDYNINLSVKELDTVLKIYNKYEKNTLKFDIQELFDVISKRMNINIPLGLTDRVLFYFSNCVPKRIDKEIVDTIRYLSLKYELVILSNFYVKVQSSRLEKVGLLGFFKEIFGYDTNSYKPLDEAYNKAIGKHLYEECVMVGDNYVHDYEKPNSLGMTSYLFDRNNKYKVKNRIQKISDLKELL